MQRKSPLKQINDGQLTPEYHRETAGRYRSKTLPSGISNVMASSKCWPQIADNLVPIKKIFQCAINDAIVVRDFTESATSENKIPRHAQNG